MLFAPCLLTCLYRISGGTAIHYFVVGTSYHECLRAAYNQLKETRFANVDQSPNELEYAKPLHASAKLEARVARKRAQRAAVRLVRSRGARGDPVIAAEAVARVLHPRERKPCVRTRLKTLVHEVEVGRDGLQRGGVERWHLGRVDDTTLVCPAPGTQGGDRIHLRSFRQNCPARGLEMTIAPYEPGCSMRRRKPEWGPPCTPCRTPRRGRRRGVP